MFLDSPAQMSTDWWAKKNPKPTDEDFFLCVCVSPPQKDPDQAVVIAVTFTAVFESADDGDDVYQMGVASQLLQVNINKCHFCV